MKRSSNGVVVVNSLIGINGITSNSTPREKMKTQKICLYMFVVLFIIAKFLKQLKCPLIGE